MDLSNEQMNTRLIEEKKRRNEFLAWITPSIKAEFINSVPDFVVGK
jgi:hypothetical protein